MASTTGAAAAASPQGSDGALPPDTRLGFIGSGAMATALISGLIRSNALPASRIAASDPDESKLQQLQSSLHISACSSNSELVSGCSIVVLAVKPQVVQAVMREVGQQVREDQLLISIAAGVTLQTLQSLLPAGRVVARVVPNTPALIGRGASAIALSSSSPQHAQHLRNVSRIFSAVGTVVSCTEQQLDAVTGLSGSGPAFVFLFLEALADGGVRAGLPRALADRLAAQTVLGAASMMLEPGGQHAGQLKDQVASPGGTTIAGIHALELGAFRGCVMSAVLAARNRAEEMGRQYSSSSSKL